MIGVMIVPTGLGAEIGGHAGDATPAARMLATLCDKLIVHPNVVNASDICEMTENMLYVEGSMLDRFLEGEIRLDEVRNNQVLVVANAPLKPELINSVSAARVTLGMDVSLLELKQPLIMRGSIDRENEAVGDVEGWQELVEQVEGKDFDALAISTPIVVDLETKQKYIDVGGTNPWGGVEAMVSKLISAKLNKPVAHAPIAVGQDDPMYAFSEVVDPRMAAEFVSISYLHCVLKGLQRAPRCGRKHGKGLGRSQVDFLVAPDGCWGRPHRACERAGIPIIVVQENKVQGSHPGGYCPTYRAKNYWEAAGIVSCMKAGVLPSSVRRPLGSTTIERGD